MSAKAASFLQNSLSLASSPALKRVFSRRTISPGLTAATLAQASSPTVSVANVTFTPGRSSARRSATGLSVNFLISFLAFSKSSSVAAALSSSGKASIFAFSFLLSFIFSSSTLCGLPRCEQRITFAPCSSKYLIVGSAPLIRFSSVITPSFIGTLKSTRTRHLFPATSTSRMDFLFISLLLIFFSTI